MIRKIGLPLCIGILILSFLTGCGAVTRDGQTRLLENPNTFLSSENSYGQTFTADRSGLNGVNIFLAPGSGQSTGNIILHLQKSPDSYEILNSSLDISQITHPGYYRFNFPAQSDSYMMDYYFELEFVGQGSVLLGSGNGSSYINGSLYLNGKPLDLQIGFQQVFNPFQSIAGMVWLILKWFLGIMLTGLVFLLPGWALLHGLLEDWQGLSWGEKAGLAAGVGLALIPLVLLWIYVTGIALGSLTVWIMLIVSILFLVWKNLSAIKQIPSKLNRLTWNRFNWTSAALIFTLVVIVLIRVWIIQGIDYPMWGDSYQHTMIAQLILDHGGLFKSWEPYVPYSSLTVQYGFSASVAFYSWLSSVASPQSTIWVGQIINAIAILTIFPLMLRMTKKNYWAGIAALIIAGLFMPMPMMYVNWGRYAQLAGQAILPIAIWLCWEAFSQPGIRWKKIILVGVTLTGMLLTYYRMFFYFATFFLAWLLLWGIVELRLDMKKWKPILLNAGLIIILTVLLTVPWLFFVQGSTLALSVEAGIKSGSPLSAIMSDYALWKDTSDYVPVFIQILCAVSLIWSLIRKNWMMAGIVLWVALLSAVKAGQMINLPGAVMMQSFAVLIYLYIPASLMSGWLLGEIANSIRTASPRRGELVLCAVVVFVCMLGFYRQRHAGEPQTYAYVTRPDIRASEWIKSNLPIEAKFLVEGYRINNGESAVGGDGGWWLPISAQRANTMPPQYALLAESSQPREYSQQVVDLIAALEVDPLNSPKGISAICQMGATHVYIGQGQGLVGFGVRALFNREQLIQSDDFQEIYHQDRVSIFSITPSACKN